MRFLRLGSPLRRALAADASSRRGRFARMYRAQAGDGKGGIDDDWEM